MSLQQLTGAVLSVYRQLLSFESSAGIQRRTNRTYEMIKLLEDPVSLESKIAKNSLSKHEMFLLSSAILDGYALTSATEGKGFKVGDTNYLASSKHALESKMLNNREWVEDFLFSILVQAWHNSKSSTRNIKDLVLLDKFKEQQVCDFKLDTSEGSLELIECKRIHPKSSDKVSLDKVVEKVRSNAISKAKDQFTATEDKLGKRAKYRHVLIDISAYGEYFEFEKHDMTIEGFDPDDHITSILKRTEGKNIKGVDIVTLCWTNIFFQNEVLIAKTFNSDSINLSSKINPSFEFDGFTIEMYPDSTTGQKYREVRISSKVRSPSWIKFTWNNIADTENFWGKWTFQGDS